MDVVAHPDGATTLWSFSVYETLAVREEDGIVPGLATDWELDGTTWVFTLRDGVQFHNGEELTAEDVVASFELLNSEESDSRGNMMLLDTEFEVIDERTVGISRPTVDPTTPARTALVPIVPAELANEPDRLANEMIGTGPYKFDGWERTQHIDLSAYENYWGEQPHIDRVQVLFDADAAVRMSALQAGEIQLAMAIPADLAKAADSYETFTYTLSEVVQLRVNTLSGPGDDQTIRQAMSLAIDRELIIDELFGGFAALTQGQPVADYVDGFNPDLADLEFDPDQARQTLEEADALGTEVSLVGSSGRWTNDSQIAEAVAAMLTEVGFEVDLRLPPFPEWVEMWFGETEFAPDSMLVYHSNSLFDSSFTIEQLLVCDGSSSVHCDEDFERLVEQVRQEPDEEARFELIREIWAQNREQLWLLPIAEVKSVAVGVQELDWEPGIDNFITFQDIGIGE